MSALPRAPNKSSGRQRRKSSKSGHASCASPLPTKKSPKSVYSSKCIFATAK